MISAGLGSITGATLGSVTGAVSGPGLIGVVPAPTAVDCAALDPVLLFFASFLETATPAKVPAVTAAEPAPSLATFFTREVAGLTTRLEDNFLGATFRDDTFFATAFFATAFLAGAFFAIDERTVLEPAAMAPLLSMTEGNTSAPKSAMPTERVSHILTRSSELAFFWILSIWILTFHSYRR